MSPSEIYSMVFRHRSNFALTVNGQVALMDEARTGPPAHSLLHGASLNMILTWVVPAGSESSLTLVYRPVWLNGSLVFTGYQKPLGAI